MATQQDLTNAGIEFGKSSNGQVMFRGPTQGGFASNEELQQFGIDPNSISALGNQEAGWTRGKSGNLLGQTYSAIQSAKQTDAERAKQASDAAQWNATGAPGQVKGPVTATNSTGLYSSQAAADYASGNPQTPNQGTSGLTVPPPPAGMQNTPPSKFETGFNNANSSQGYTKDAQGNVYDAQGNHVNYADLPKGPNGSPLMNLDNLPASTARGVVGQYVPQDNTDQNTKLDSLFAADPVLAQLQAERQNLATTTQTSFMDDYNAMAKASGMNAVDARMIDINKIIDGTEESIRHEITAAGGMATERQVLALTNAANKGLIAEYKTLTAQKTAITSQLNTMIGLDEKDRAAAEKRYGDISALDKQIATREQQVQTNNSKTYQFLQKTVGYKGLLDATGGDPYYTSLIEKTLGLPPGGLAKAAQSEVAKAPAVKIIGTAKSGYYRVNADGSTTPIKLGGGSPTSPTSPKSPKPYAFSAKNLTALQTEGLDPADAQGILKDIQAGHSFEDIRHNMTANGIDWHLLDNVMQIVDPKNNKPATKSSSTSVSI